MKIKLACPSAWFERPELGDNAGATVDVDDQLGMQLIREGYAQADAAHLTGSTVDQVAALEGVDVSGANTVAEKKAAVKAARNQEG
jgi:hypothetical protein